MTAPLRSRGLCAVALLLVLAACCVLESYAAKTFTCPENCLSCKRSRGRIVKKGPRRLMGIESLRRADGLLATIPACEKPLITVCTKCDDGYVISKSQKKCDCAPGHAVTPTSNGTCAACPPGTVAPSAPPGSKECTPCPDGEKPSADNTECVSEGEVPELPTCGDRLCGVLETPTGSIFCGFCPGNKYCDDATGTCKEKPQPPCTPATACKDPAKVCGFESDGCGGAVPCGPPENGGSCPGNATCSSDQLTCVPPPPDCVPKTCPADRICGKIKDGCGGIVECGPGCPEGSYCAIGGTRCQENCVPKTQCDPGIVCGLQPNGCGGNIICGFCPTGYTCAPGGTKCETETPPEPPCVPNAVECTGKTCGAANDGCGGIISCGECAAGQTCEANGTCVTPVDPPPEICVPKTECSREGRKRKAPSCGTQDNGCGGVIVCGECPGDYTCHLGECTPPNPVCKPKTECSKACGPEDDLCGGVLDCGTCPDGFLCAVDGSECTEIHVPPNPDVDCSEVECGTVPDGAGNAYTCPNTCLAGQTCEGNKCTTPPCIPNTVCPYPQICGTHSSCGIDILCGECPDGKTCSPDGSECTDKPNLCSPATSCSTGRVCGYEDDGCDGLIPCGPPELAGDCPPGSICNADGTECIEEKPPGCEPRTECSPGTVCGEEDDGCGGTVKCGSLNGECPDGLSCTVHGDACVEVCVPKTRCDDGYTCGTQDNGCGGTILCGECAEDYVCTVDAATNTSKCQPEVVTCIPETTCPVGLVCGVYLEPCGHIVHCGTCPAEQSCAADGKSCEEAPEVCIPMTQCTDNRRCGTQDDGCEGLIVCGRCRGNQTCIEGECIEPEEPPPDCVVDKNKVCEDRVCGEVDDGCGGLISCGECGNGDLCSSDGSECYPPHEICTPVTKCSVKKCGAEPDGCGGMIVCGTCPQDQLCVQGQCQAKPCADVNAPCKNNTDCCWSSTDTVCFQGLCKVQREGKCQNNNMCGACQPNCGGNTVASTCELYGITDPKCNHAATGGGGHECAQTDVCCVITKPTPITPINGHCFAHWPPRPQRNRRGRKHL